MQVTVEQPLLHATKLYGEEQEASGAFHSSINEAPPEASACPTSNLSIHNMSELQ
jgi:hypothetical protein